MQYGIRLAEMYGKHDMPYPEFCRLLAGVGAKTPLGIVVSIRSEQDRNTLKHFTPEQRRIRSEWRSKSKPAAAMSDQEKEAAEKQLQSMFASMFGAGK